MKNIRSTATLACALLFSVFANADGHETPGNVADGWMMHVKAGMAEEFEEAFTRHIKYRESKGDTRSWQVYTPVVGDKLGYYAVRACCMQWADLDSYRQWGVDNAIGDHWNENVDQYVDKYQHRLYDMDFENSNWPEDDSSVTLIGVTRFYKKMGMAGQIEQAKERMSSIAKEGSWPRNWSWSDAIGGKDVLLLATPYDNYAAMKPLEQGFMDFMTEQLGSADEAGKVMAQFTGGVSYTTYTVYRHRKDLSMESSE